MKKLLLPVLLLALLYESLVVCGAETPNGSQSEKCTCERSTSRRLKRRIENIEFSQCFGEFRNGVMELMNSIVQKLSYVFHFSSLGTFCVYVLPAAGFCC